MADSLHLPETAPTWRVRIDCSADAPITLSKALTVCGRSPTCDLVLQAAAVSRQHFQIHCRDGGCYLEDLQSRGGTFLMRGEGYNNGSLQPDCEIQPGGWQVIGLTPLRAGDVFGSITYLTLERSPPISLEDWTLGVNSQAMLLAIRGTRLADTPRLRQFLARCMGLIAELDRNEKTFRRLREHPDVWSAAAGFARFIVATSTRYEGNFAGGIRLDPQIDANIWQACRNSESVICGLLRETFRFDSSTLPS